MNNEIAISIITKKTENFILILKYFSSKLKILNTKSLKVTKTVTIRPVRNTYLNFWNFFNLIICLYLVLNQGPLKK